MTEFKVQPKSLGEYVRCLSGFFMTKTNPAGLTPKECTVLAALCFVLKNCTTEITKEKRVQLANLTNHNTQVITNYISKFKKKGVIVDNKLHPVFYKKIILQYGENNM